MTGREVGPEIEGLTFVEHLGAGGYSDVYLYERRKPRMPVAVKVLTDQRLSEAEANQFAAEAETMAELADHPFIVQVFNTGVTDEGRPFLVMKYYPPPNLAKRAASERFTVAEVLRTGIQIASAVETAHRAGILHRDIKPANILLSQYGSPGLADFGIAGKAGSTEDDDELGVSIPWSPPEVLSGESNGSVASDVYSLAATMWHLLAGRSPYEVAGGDNSPRALTGRILTSSPRVTGRADAPRSLERLLQQAMSKHPQHRPESAAEFARSLQGVEQELRYARTELVVDGSIARPVSKAAPEAPGDERGPTKDPSEPREAPIAPPASPGSPPAPEPTALRTDPDRNREQFKPRPQVPADPTRSPVNEPRTTVRPMRPSVAARTTGNPVPAHRVDPANPVARQRASLSSAPPEPATSRRPLLPTTGEAPDQAAVEPTAAAGGLGRGVVVGIVTACVVAVVGIGIVLTQGSGTGSPNEPAPQSPPGSDQGGFDGGSGVVLPTVTATTDPSRQQVTFRWSLPAGGEKNPTFRYRINNGQRVDGQATSKTVPTVDPAVTCIVVGVLASDGKFHDAGKVCGA